MTHPGERVQVDVKVVSQKCIADPELRLFQYTAIDEFTRLRFLAAYPEQSTYSSADFLRKLTVWYARRGIKVECVQTDNGFEFTNRFSNSKRDLPTLFEKTAAELGIRHKLIRPYTPRHNGKVERSHREDQKRFYSCPLCLANLHNVKRRKRRSGLGRCVVPRKNRMIESGDSKKREEGNDRKNYCTPRPLNCGSRFSIKASTASQKSCVRAQSHMASASRKARRGRSAYTVWSRFCLMRLTA